ncbi:hypothetical protein ACTJIJ_03365 [Niabella sp. 22666]|uniref:hypothetical protein n=1 Tax=Niabella sp. 22666 TaxID=3453954 RepID=UPI003F854B57
MKYLLFFSLFLSFKIGHCQETKKTRLYIIGTVHESSAILNPQMLFEILDHIKPDILLQENDSEQISSYFKDISPQSNEQNASLMYLKKYPGTLNLPFEFEGRNQYRRNNGMVPTDNLTIALIDSLYKKNLLSPANTKIFEKYKEANKALIEFSKKGIRALNSDEFEAANRNRQYIQHHELPAITGSEEIFSKRFVLKPNGEKISFKEGYQLWCNFWDLRNNTMAINIIKKANEHKGKKIAILTGVQHKYYLKELLHKYYDGSYEIVEYFK